MYLGFMKRGLSLTLYAVAICAATAVLYMPALLILLPPVWLYAFFDAMNLNSCDGEYFDKVEDGYITFDFLPDLHSPLLQNINKGFWGRSLIFVGSMFFMYNLLQILGDNFFHTEQLVYISWIINDILNYTPRFIIAVVLIIMGVSLMKKKNSTNEDEELFREFVRDIEDVATKAQKEIMTDKNTDTTADKDAREYIKEAEFTEDEVKEDE